MFMLSFIDPDIVLFMFMLSFIDPDIVLSMFMLSFTFVILWSFLSGSESVHVFLSFVYICIAIRGWRVGVPFSGLTHHICVPV
jgi:hypothetical protein